MILRVLLFVLAITCCFLVEKPGAKDPSFVASSSLSLSAHHFLRASADNSNRNVNNAKKVVSVSVEFYGESQCPFCRKFVSEIWHEIWSDEELRSYIDYTFVPWGNAYFATSMCGKGPYDPSERACFYEKCITTTTTGNDSKVVDDDACFGGETVYQHSTKEGQVDIYESCMIQIAGLEAAVDFTYCAEKPGGAMDDDDSTAHDILVSCVSDGVDPDIIHNCLKDEGHDIEVANAKATPVHEGVPYVIVNGLPMENPMNTKQFICQTLQKQDAHPQGCASTERSISFS